MDSYYEPMEDFEVTRIPSIKDEVGKVVYFEYLNAKKDIEKFIKDYSQAMLKYPKKMCSIGDIV